MIQGLQKYILFQTSHFISVWVEVESLNTRRIDNRGGLFCPRVDLVLLFPVLALFASAEIGKSKKYRPRDTPPIVDLPGT